MVDINDYIKKSKKQRQKHLKLNTKCIEVGGCSTNFRILLVAYLKTTMPSGSKILLCHACNNAKCSNVNHLYWGTPKENLDDKIATGTYKTFWEKCVEKYGYKKACKMNTRGNKSAGGKANKGIQKSEEHKRKISETIKLNWQKRKMIG